MQEKAVHAVFILCYAVERHFRGCKYKTLTHPCFARSKPHKIKKFLPLNANIDHDKLRAKTVYCFRSLDYLQAKTETAAKDALAQRLSLTAVFVFANSMHRYNQGTVGTFATLTVSHIAPCNYSLGFPVHLQEA